MNAGKVPEMPELASSTGYLGPCSQDSNANRHFMMDSLLMKHELGLSGSQKPHSFNIDVELKNWP